VQPDTGEVAIRKRTRLSSVAQNSEFPPDATIRFVIAGALDHAEVLEKERASHVVEPLGRAGFTDLDMPPAGEAQSAITKKKLSYLEVRELETIEERIAEADKNLEAKRAALEDPAVTSDPPRLKAACIEMEEAQNALDRLYERWAELEKKKSGF
jgi:ABC transport system ATP-binding/permease protein